VCKVQEQNLFTHPYAKDRAENKVKPKLKEAADRRVYDNPRLLGNMNLFKAKFLDDKDCIVHGALHAGSVLIKDGVPKVRQIARTDCLIVGVCHVTKRI
jgi:5-methylthioribose kinase